MDRPAPALLYRLATRVFRGLAPHLEILAPKLREVADGRRADAARFRAWGALHRDPGRPVVVFHGASAGELRALEPVIARLRRRHPEWHVALTYTSPSAAALATGLAPDIAGHLPWDVAEDLDGFLAALAPTALVFSRYDVWPGLALAAAHRGIRLGLVGGRVRAGSGRLRRPASTILRPAYARLDAVSAVTADDAGRLITLGVPSARLEITGDPRVDAVLERLEGLPRPAGHPAMLVAGSTWPADEDVLLDALVRLRHRGRGPRLLLVPHEPTHDHLERLARQARSLGLPAPAPLDGATDESPLMVVAEVGRLARLYPIGAVAYVGGGFGRAGLHSVLEPAAWGRPVIVGPQTRECHDAGALEGAGGLWKLPAREPGRALEALWARALDDAAWRREAGAAAEATVRGATGGANRCAALVERLVSS